MKFDRLYMEKLMKKFIKRKLRANKLKDEFIRVLNKWELLYWAEFCDRHE